MHRRMPENLMADEFTPPSGDPADEESLVGVFRAVLAKFLQGVDDCLPCVVTGVSGRDRVTVQPQIMMGATDGSKVSRAPLASVPILNLGAGGFVMSFPVKVGDFGWIKASDRDTSLFFQGMKEDWPNTKRMHSFSDGFFIPHLMRAWTLDGADADRVVIQSVDGSTRVAIGAGIVEVTAASMHLTGDLQVDGAFNADGGVTGAGIVLETHTHPGVQTGGGNTGAPQ